MPVPICVEALEADNLRQTVAAHQIFSGEAVLLSKMNW